jgi:hypothetical protein
MSKKETDSGIEEGKECNRREYNDDDVEMRVWFI